MEHQAPYSSQVREDVKVIQEKHKGEVLTDDQIIAFVGNAEIGIDSSVVWFGYQIAQEETPFYRFSEILKYNYDHLNPDEKLQLLSGAGKFVLGAIRPNISFAHREVEHFSKEEYTAYEYTVLSRHLLEIRQRNVGEYLLRCLEFCQGDVQKSKEFIVGNMKDFDPKMGTESSRSPLIRFYSTPQDEAISDHYININPKIAQLAFMLEADLFGFPSSLLTYLLESVFPNAPTDVKTQLMLYISQKILNKDFTNAGLVDISFFLQKNRNFYKELRIQNPSDQLAQAYDLADKSLMFHNFRDKIRGRGMVVDDLLILLEDNPFLIKYISYEELEKALDSTLDHGIALRIERIKKEKKALNPPAVSNL